MILVDGRVLPITASGSPDHYDVKLGSLGAASLTVDAADTLHFEATPGSTVSLTGTASSTAIALRAVLNAGGETSTPIDLSMQEGALSGSIPAVTMRLGGLDMAATNVTLLRDVADTKLTATLSPSLSGFGPLLTGPVNVAWDSNSPPSVPCFTFAKNLRVFDGSQGPLTGWHIGVQNVRSQPATCTPGSSFQSVAFDLAVTSD
ncbi:MAG TPA: hypothetical protein VGC96_04930, partial [Candidatus Elarobacter sp.]